MSTNSTKHDFKDLREGNSQIWMDQIKESCVYTTSSLLRKANRQIDTGNKRDLK